MELLPVSYKPQNFCSLESENFEYFRSRIIQNNSETEMYA